MGLCGAIKGIEHMWLGQTILETLPTMAQMKCTDPGLLWLSPSRVKLKAKPPADSVYSCEFQTY